jgi:hypothetical protein
MQSLALASLVPARLACTLIGIGALSVSASAQAGFETLGLASPTSTSTLGSHGAIEDQDLVAKCASENLGRPWLVAGGWPSFVGDWSGDGRWDVPGDIDALSIIDPWGVAAPSEFVFSLLADEGGYEDGDLLRRNSDGSLEVYYSEANLRAALGTTSIAVDVDALAIGSQQELWFSLASDLSASVLGPIADGDVLVLDVQGNLRRAHSEADLQRFAETAKGTALSAILDCIALSFDPVDGVLAFVVQSPSDIDGSAIRVDGRFVSGFQEADWGFTTAVELDALTFWRGRCSPAPRLRCLPSDLPLGTFGGCTIEGGTPGGLFLLVLGTRVGELRAQPELGGFGALLVDFGDPVFQSFAARWSELLGVFDAQGRAVFPVRGEPLLPAAFDLTLQALDLGAWSASTPWTLRIG